MFPGPLDRDASDAFVERIESGFDATGFGLWAVELRQTGESRLGAARPEVVTDC